MFRNRGSFPHALSLKRCPWPPMFFSISDTSNLWSDCRKKCKKSIDWNLFSQTSLRSNFIRIQFTNLFRKLTESQSDEGYLEALKIQLNLPWATTQNVKPRVVAYESLDHNESKFSWLEYGNCQDLTHGPMPIQCFIHVKAVVEKKTRFLPQRNFRFL